MRTPEAAAESGSPPPAPAERSVPRPDTAPREGRPERIFLPGGGGKPGLGLLAISILLHAVVLGILVPAIPVNIQPRNTRVVIEVRTWSAPLEAPRSPAPIAAPEPRPAGLLGTAPPPPQASPAGLDPIAEPVPAPDPNLLFLDPDAIYVRKDPDPREPARRRTPASGDAVPEEALRGLLDSPFLEGLPVAGTGEVTLPILIEASLVRPRYPPAARQAGARGRLVLQAVIFSDGSVGDIRVVDSPSPRLGFEEAAIEAVSQWRYVPALRHGRAVDCILTIVVEFTR